MGRPDQAVEIGPKIEVILVGRVCELSGCREFDPAPGRAEGCDVHVGGNEEGFSVTRCWSGTGDQNWTVDRCQGIW